MAKETMVAKEGGVMGLSARNAISGRTDRSLGRATYPSQNKSSFKSMIADLYEGRSYEGVNERGERTVVEYTPNGNSPFRVKEYYAPKMPSVSEIGYETSLIGYLRGIGFKNGKIKK